MAWHKEKNESGGTDLVWANPETGIAPAPTLGTANLQNVNIATEMGEVLVSYARTQQAQTPITGGTLTATSSTEFTAPANLQPGQWIEVTATSFTPQRTIEYLIVGGGGGAGGADSSGNKNSGGGAGAEVVEDSFTAPLVPTSYAVTVGAGGDGGDNTGAHGDAGETSSIATVDSAEGGGYGGGSLMGTRDGGAGVNGGGGGDDGAAGAGTNFDGGAGASGGSIGGGGGAGAGEDGQNGSNTPVVGKGGDGGDGVSSDISGSTVFYAGGGGAGGENVGGTGGNGGGANGIATSGNGNSAAANTGAGGGGVNANGAGGNGGSGIVIIRYLTGSMVATGGTITTSGSYTIHTFTSSGTFEITTPPFGLGNYYVSYKDDTDTIKLSYNYDPEVQHVPLHSATGTVTFNVLYTVGAPIGKATEKYSDGTQVQYRYYILDAQNLVWVYDTKVYADTLAANGVGMQWFLPDTDTSNDFSGITVLNGWLSVVSDESIYVKPTVDFSRAWTAMQGVSLLNIDQPRNITPHTAFVGQQGKMYYCDGNYLGQVFPNTSLETGIANVQSYCQWTAVDMDTITPDPKINGSNPVAPGTGVRIPVVFFTDQYGTLPSAITEGTVYFLYPDGFIENDYNVYDVDTGGSALDMTTGASGNQYFNTYYPLSGEAWFAGTHPLMTWEPQRLNLPYYETARAMVEIGNTLLVGGNSNILYPWNQVNATPDNIIPMPEAGVVSMINVNNMAYVFAGNKGNIYISNNSVASLAAKVPDYCAGIPGTPITYIEPYFTWGDSAFMRGRVYFSILDQTANKAGNCGGVWSFIPTQNVGAGQDVGIAMRLENQNSYGSYNGMATIILPAGDQDAISPQYWAGWQNSYTPATSTSFGIDFTDTIPATTAIIETDLLVTGTLLEKMSFEQLEYKMASPLAAGDTVQLYWRLNATDEWTSAGNVREETANRISGYYSVNFQKTQWVQIRAVLTTNGTITSSFNRFKEIRLR